MPQIGYARVSSTGQSLELQLEQLRMAGCEKVFSEKRSGGSASDRQGLQDMLEYVREGDIVMVARLDRLARSIVDLRKIIDCLESKGVGFKVLQQGAIDTTRSDGRLMLNILASFAEFENDIRRERQREGIEKAKARGAYRGRPPKIDAAAITALKAEGLGATAIAQRLKIGRASVYRVLAPVREADRDFAGAPCPPRGMRHGLCGRPES